MERKFWLERWLKNQIGFHQPEYNRHLQTYWPGLGIEKGSRVFIPLCGKSLDMRWLESQGHSVCGVEISKVAIEAYFESHNEDYRRTVVGDFTLYSGLNSEIYCGDFFELTARELQGVAGVYDRGALIALPQDMRVRYIDHLLRVLPEGTRMLLLTLEYDQNLVAGPPFSVYPEEIEALYGDRCNIERLHTDVTDQVPPHFAAQGVNRVGEAAYRITKLR